MFSLCFIYKSYHQFIRESVLLFYRYYMPSCCFLQPWDHILLYHFHIESIVEVANISEESVAIGLDILDILLSQLSTDYLTMCVYFILLFFTFVLLSSFEFLLFPHFCLLHSLCLKVFCIFYFFKVLLLFSHDSKLFFFKHFHTSCF
jgi:hypothetical protein